MTPPDILQLDIPSVQDPLTFDDPPDISRVILQTSIFLKSLKIECIHCSVVCLYTHSNLKWCIIVELFNIVTLLKIQSLTFHFLEYWETCSASADIRNVELRDLPELPYWPLFGQIDFETVALRAEQKKGRARGGRSN